MYPQREEDIQTVLEIEGYDSEGYEVTEFSRSEVAQMKILSGSHPIHGRECSLFLGDSERILLGDDVYMASAMVTKEDEALMEALKSSVYEYSWRWNL